MENCQSNQKDLSRGCGYLVEDKNKKAWLMPVVVEISKFSILTGPNTSKGDEGGFPSTFPS